MFCAGTGSTFLTVRAVPSPLESFCGFVAVSSVRLWVPFVLLRDVFSEVLGTFSAVLRYSLHIFGCTLHPVRLSADTGSAISGMIQYVCRVVVTFVLFGVPYLLCRVPSVQLVTGIVSSVTDAWLFNSGHPFSSFGD